MSFSTILMGGQLHKRFGGKASACIWMHGHVWKWKWSSVWDPFVLCRPCLPVSSLYKMNSRYRRLVTLWTQDAPPSLLLFICEWWLSRLVRLYCTPEGAFLLVWTGMWPFDLVWPYQILSNQSFLKMEILAKKWVMCSRMGIRFAPSLFFAHMTQGFPGSESTSQATNRAAYLG